MTPQASPSGPWAVYLLHFDQPVNGSRHYVGITTYDRLGRRMIEHTTGRGAKLTAAACRQGTSWRLAHIWRTEEPALEGTLISRREARQLCPVCRSISTGIGYRPTNRGPADRRGLFRPFHLVSPRPPQAPADQAPELPLENSP